MVMRISILLVFTLLLILPFTQPVFAQEIAITSAPDPNTQQVNYQLPYPGLLPDHPLYFLKAVRERILSHFISNPLKKAEFNLLQADKRIQAALMLIEKRGDKVELSQSTYSKGENYFEKAINNATEAKMQGVDVTEFAKKLRESNTKHKQVLRDIKNKLKDRNNNTFKIEAERLIEFDKKVRELARKK